MIVGIDEVGRGAWAGPLTVGAVLLGGQSIEGLTDSKKLTKKRREQLNVEIRQKAAAIGLGWVSARQIDAIGLSASLQLAARRALAHIKIEYHEIIIDGTLALIHDPRVTLMKQADLLVPSVSAASIVAKVARDNYMRQLHAVFPEYKFPAHVGYGTFNHRQAIERYGVTPVHRLSFEPLATYKPKDLPAAARTYQKSRLTTKNLGDTAEDVAAVFLRNNGHTILKRNWRTKLCEIDIVSSFNGTMYFTEVKFRKNDSRGGGLAAVTVRKQQQMKFAAQVYAASEHIVDTDLCLAVIEISGQKMDVTAYLELR